MVMGPPLPGRDEGGIVCGGTKVHDAVGDTREERVVGDDEGGAVGDGLVEEQHGGVADDGAGNCDAAALAAGQGLAPWPTRVS
jgi:hypothetical protein